VDFSLLSLFCAANDRPLSLRIVADSGVHPGFNLRRPIAARASRAA
jgi:hypothetical protein